jgi:hypothetical protein
MKLIKYLLPLIALPGILLFSACTASVDVHAGTDGSAEISYGAVFGNALVEVMKSLSEAGSGPLFDTRSITEQLQKAGIQTAKVSSPSDSALTVSASLAAGSKDPVSAVGFLSGSAHSLTLTLSPEKLSALYTAMPETVQSYIDLFMAPVFGGTVMTAEDYVNLVASVYGQPVGDEVAAAQIRITLYGPAGSGIRKTVTVPLTDILTASKPLVYSVTW